MATNGNLIEKNAKSKYFILKTVGESGNISKTCRQLGVPRSRFYEIKRRYQLGGLEALQVATIRGKICRPFPRPIPGANRKR